MKQQNKRLSEKSYNILTDIPLRTVVHLKTFDHLERHTFLIFLKYPFVSCHSLLSSHKTQMLTIRVKFKLEDEQPSGEQLATHLPIW